jgi:nickel-dependent lactate racemase
MQLTLPYGRHGLPVTLPDHNLRHVLRLTPLPPLRDPAAAIRAALATPTGTPPLAEVARGRREAVIVVSDLTRPVPSHLLLPPLLETLQAAGLPPQRVTILVATGLHRGNTPAELAEMLGPEVLASGCRVVNHDARDLSGQVDLGQTARGVPVKIDRHYVNADLKILTGLIEPHLMAGYSGGRKAICPGLCAAETIMAWHSPALLASPRAEAGNLDHNPVHEEALAIADLAGGADFLLNVVLSEQREITGVVAGDLLEAHAAGVAIAERQARVTIPEPVDIVLTTAAGYPLDLTFYQGVKGLVAALPIVRPGGIIIIAQENAEGLGSPEFAELILGCESLGDFMAQAMCGEVCRIDQWQLQEMDKVCRQATVFNVSSGLPAELQAQLFVTPQPTVEAALAQALDQLGPDSTLAVIPEGPYVLAGLQALG